MGERVTGGKRGAVDTVLHASVATLYSNLVTRPTGRAVRFAIEQQIEESSGTCLSILDFSRVGVIDFSCADEIIAKLLQKYRRSDRPADAFFVLKGVAEHHREPIEAVLRRHGLLLVIVEQDRPALWGPAPTRLRTAWDWLNRFGGRAVSDDFATARGLNAKAANSWLNRLVSWRVAVPDGRDHYSSLPAIMERPSYAADANDPPSFPAAAEQAAEYGAEPGTSRATATSEELNSLPPTGGDVDRQPRV